MPDILHHLAIKSIIRVSCSILLIGLGSSLSLYSQNNLVPNPSFEGHSEPPSAISQLYLAPPWKGFATDAGSVPADYYHKDAYSEIASVPFNYLGFQEPRTGKAYAGFIAYSEDYPYYREFVQVQLREILTRDTLYYAEVFVSLAEKRTIAISDLGLLFTHYDPFAYIFSFNYIEQLKDKNKTPIKQEIFSIHQPQVTNDPENIIKEQRDWVKISGTFKAGGGENWLTIGNFTKRKKTLVEKVLETLMGPDYHNDAYYYIDDILVIKAADKDLYLAPKQIVESKTVQPLPDYFSELKEDQPVTLKNVYFKSDEAIIQPQSYMELNQLFDFLDRNKKIRILIEGHTDNTNTELYNLNLSLSRAEAVKQYLVNKGIEHDRVETHGHGEYHPIADNLTEEGKQLNRRVVFRIIR